MKTKPWSKLQKEIENLFVDDLHVKIQCRAYRMKSQRGCSDLPRYWITLDKETIFDYPKDFPDLRDNYPYFSDVSEISKLIREYIDTPVIDLLHKEFNDPWKLTSILLAADRRIGRRRLEELRDRLRTLVSMKVFEMRIDILKKMERH